MFSKYGIAVTVIKSSYRLLKMVGFEGSRGMKKGSGLFSTVTKD
jgi:hypothetical protein